MTDIVIVASMAVAAYIACFIVLVAALFMRRRP